MYLQKDTAATGYMKPEVNHNVLVWNESITYISEEVPKNENV